MRAWMLLLLVSVCVLGPSGTLAQEGELRIGELRLAPLPELEANAAGQLPERALPLPELLRSARIAASGLEPLAESFGDLGRLYHAWGLSQQAEICYRNARSLAPGDDRWPYYLGGLQHSQGRLDEALASWVNAMAVRATSIGLYRMSETLVALARFDEAVAVLENARRLNPSSAALPVALAKISLRRQRPREAVIHLQRALELEPEADLLYAALAGAYRQLGERELAEQSEARAGKRGIDLPDQLRDELAEFRTEGRIDLLGGDLALRAGRLEEAVASYSRASESSPVARHRLALTLLELGRTSEAKDAFRAALDLAPDDPRTLEGLGLLLLEEGENDAAIEHLTLAAALAPERAHLQLQLAEALVARGQLEESLPYFTATSRIAPQEARAWLGGIRALLALDRNTEASEILAIALKALPGNEALLSLQSQAVDSTGGGGANR